MLLSLYKFIIVVYQVCDKNNIPMKNLNVEPFIMCKDCILLIILSRFCPAFPMHIKSKSLM